MILLLKGNMREIVLDTETTGLDPAQGHRLVELGCVELLNRIPTGSTFHVYLNPERDMPAEAYVAVMRNRAWRQWWFRLLSDRSSPIDGSSPTSASLILKP